VHLPGADADSTRRGLRRRFPDAHETPSPIEIREAIDRIAALLRGEHVDLSSIEIDLSAVPSFDRDVYRAARDIPVGATRTYGEIARVVGRPDGARDVGVALSRNPFAIVVPCHRVVAANGKIGGFSAAAGVATKLRLLAIEGGLTEAPLFQQ
jgi:methylated-DNA-[protein]-cysteine S-methyltransferase